MSDSAKSPGPDQLRLEAAQKRAELGETLDQLMAKTDVKARAAQLVHEKAPQPVREHPRQVLAAAAAAVAVATGLVIWGLKRRGGGGGQVKPQQLKPKHLKVERLTAEQLKAELHKAELVKAELLKQAKAAQAKAAQVKAVRVKRKPTSPFAKQLKKLKRKTQRKCGAHGKWG
ncbi:DUF3618 domain-containing protein [Streptomyces lichenis]|uniref:DUF3618 domain-containing protein n=1 Tax=Streptomyces lichenis TaxID=2306967 RepID=A0ABT0ICH9_9ACTN|nr:DUF3618 domain-containing protein [Streptomyces lichenis]MCK8679019.1 DUF3618 domain-containing protein [Streptomyces lichenis]